MIILDLILVLFAMSLVLYIGLALYKIPITKKDFLTIILVQSTIVWLIRLSSLNIIWQTIFGILVFVLAIKFYLQQSWFISLITIFTSYLISLIGDSLVVIILKYFAVSFSELYKDKNLAFYLFGILAKAPQLIIALLIHYQEIYLTQLHNNE